MKPRVGDVVIMLGSSVDEGTLGTVIKEDSFPNYGWVMLSTGETRRFADNIVRLIVQKEQDSYSNTVL